MHLFSFGFDRIMKRRSWIKIRIGVFKIFNSSYWSLIIIGQTTHDRRFSSNQNITLKYIICMEEELKKTNLEFWRPLRGG